METSASFIEDGHHLPATVLQAMIRAAMAQKSELNKMVIRVVNEVIDWRMVAAKVKQG